MGLDNLSECRRMREVATKLSEAFEEVWDFNTSKVKCIECQLEVQPTYSHIDEFLHGHKVFKLPDRPEFMCRDCATKWYSIKYNSLYYSRMQDEAIKELDSIKNRYLSTGVMMDPPEIKLVLGYLCTRCGNQEVAAEPYYVWKRCCAGRIIAQFSCNQYNTYMDLTWVRA